MCRCFQYKLRNNLIINICDYLVFIKRYCVTNNLKQRFNLFCLYIDMTFL